MKTSTVCKLNQNKYPASSIKHLDWVITRESSCAGFEQGIVRLLLTVKTVKSMCTDIC